MLNILELMKSPEPSLADSDGLSATWAKAVILSGPSSVGKTTIAHQLQRLAVRPAVFLGDDVFVPSPSVVEDHIAALSAPEWSSWRDAFFRGYFEGLRAFVTNGFHAIGEVVFTDQARLDIAREVLADTPHLFVRVHCDTATRQARARARRDRPPGLSDQSAIAEIVAPSDMDVERPDARHARLLLTSRSAWTS